MQTSRIISDTIAYGKKYYWAVNFPFLDKLWIRTDSTTGSLYSLDKNGTCGFYDHEKIIDSLLAGLNDSTKNCLSSSSRPKCTDTSYINIFGELRQKKGFIVNCSNPPISTCSTARTYLDSIGIYNCNGSSSGGGGGGSSTWELRGGIINGLVFGDTSTAIGINTISSEIPKTFSLSQNFPNPFNPATKIKFDIPNGTPPLKGAGGMMTSLIIYDILGREVITLVNETLKPGTYEAEWDAGNFSSGLFFYKLQAGDPSTSSGQSFVETKKMVLIK